MGSNVKLERIFITESEHIDLICAATDGKYIGCSFGTEGVKLLPTEDNRWAFEMISMWRSNVKVRGGTLL